MSVETVPITPKQIAVDAVAHMPETVTLAEISERLAILAGIESGQDDIDAGRVVTHDEAKRRSLAWIGK